MSASKREEEAERAQRVLTAAAGKGGASPAIFAATTLRDETRRETCGCYYSRLRLLLLQRAAAATAAGCGCYYSRLRLLLQQAAAATTSGGVEKSSFLTESQCAAVCVIKATATWAG